MQDNSASRTALGTAFLRAVHQVLETAPLVLDDPIALPILGPHTEGAIRFATDRYQAPAARMLRSHVVLRSRFAEARLQAAMARGVSQYVVLGAGFDTFAFRQPPWSEGKLTIFEVDHPDTQQLKQSKLREAAIRLPDNLVFAGVDFEKETLVDALIRAGVRFDTPTFFSWLGVTMYLTETAIDATLQCITTFARQSEVVLTFMQPSDDGANHWLGEHLSRIGEPLLSHFTPEAMQEKLLTSGFGLTHFLTPELSAAYFPEHAGSLPNLRRTSIVAAIKV